MSFFKKWLAKKTRLGYDIKIMRRGRGGKMSKIKHWMAVTEDAFWEVYFPEITFSDLVRKVRNKVTITDEGFLRRLYTEAKEG
jgi:hypothetical protein